MEFFAPYMEHITALCRKHKVRSLHAFGSAVKGGMGPESDVDLVVDIDAGGPLEYGERYFALLFAFEELFKRPIDLLEERTLTNKYFVRAMNAHKVTLYGS
jgi:predicted nucleotidyltransferase